MVFWMLIKIQWKATRKSTENGNLTKFENNYKKLTKTDFYMNFHFYRESLGHKADLAN
jgi:hypothetical protein